LNAAAVLMTAGRANNIREGIELAGKAIDSSAVTRLVSTLRAGNS